MYGRVLNLFIFCCCLFCGQISRADVYLHRIFTTNMVLQRDVDIPIFGNGNDGEWVTVTFDGETHSVPCVKGEWITYFTPRDAGGPFTIEVKGVHNETRIDNVMMGDVWICGGQSNMHMALVKTEKGEEEAAGANDSEVRLMGITLKEQDTPQSDLTENQSPWREMSPKTVGGFSAVGYYFAKKIKQEIKVPIGLIQACKGGTHIEQWMSEKSLAGESLYSSDLAGTPGFSNKPSLRYNGMIAPLTRFPVKGIIWYQGESNAKTYAGTIVYSKLFRRMITDWRLAWGMAEMPFLFVQLAAFKDVNPIPDDSVWARFREAQTSVEKADQVGMALALDVGAEKDIHPKDKKTVGDRLALLGLKIAYRKDVICSGPRYNYMRVEGDKAIISFKKTGSGLMVRDYIHDTHYLSGDKLQGFAIKGEDTDFVWANAKIEGNTVVLSHPKIKKPVAVRYGWADFPLANLYNNEGLPAAPFRTDWNTKPPIDKK